MYIPVLNGMIAAHIFAKNTPKAHRSCQSMSITDAPPRARAVWGAVRTGWHPGAIG